jgi:hypothetical protein
MSDDAATRAVNTTQNNYGSFHVNNLNDARKADILKACELALKD